MVAPPPPIDPRLLGAAPMGLGPGTPMPALGGPQAMASTVIGQLGGQMPGLPAADPFGDPVLAQMSQNPPNLPVDPMAGLPDHQKPGYMPKLDAAVWLHMANNDMDRWQRLLRRLSRDLMLYRTHYSAKPPDFDPKKEIAFKSATVPNVVNKLTNMASPLDMRYVIPFKDEQSKKHSQIVENALSYWRECEKLSYAEAGGHGSLQWDEFFYLFLYGRYCKRILPAPWKTDGHPFEVTLLDPATVFPTWGGANEGLVRIFHRRPMAALDVIATYGTVAANLNDKLKAAVREAWATEDEYRFFNTTKELIEGWDSWRRWVSWGGQTIFEAEHKLGYVPFFYVTAKGEPRGMTTPTGRYYFADENGMESIEDLEVLVRNISEPEDEFHKGVSVFHHIVNTNRMVEVFYTVLTNEVLKAQDPPTITYSPPTMAGQAPPPLSYKRKANNQRILPQRVEIAPTSPRPTDLSPIMQKMSGDITEGTVNPAMYGGIEGSNIAGFAIESMIAAAKDTILPYLRAWEIGQQMQASIQLKQYREQILPLQTVSVPMDGRYGNAATEDLSREVVQSAGHKVSVEIIGVSDQQLPMLVNAYGAALERGIKSRRQVMEKLGDKDPDRTVREIIIERAMEHPEMMENFLIPIEFIRSGQKDMADLWVLMVVMPKIQMLMMKMLGPMAQGVMAGPQAAGAMPAGANPLAALGPGGGAPQQNGQSNPMAGRAMAPPGGPEPGQGRGAAPQPAMR